MDSLDADRVTRRRMLRWTGTAGMLGVVAVVAEACTPATPGTSTTTTTLAATTTTMAPTTTTTVLPPDANGLVLQPGFTSRVVARSTEEIGGTGHVYRWYPDGAATFADPEVAGGWYLTVNHEVGAGGVTSIRFAPDGTIAGAQSVCDGTSVNCAGGATPWGTWLSCEEYGAGRVWECDPTGASPAQVRDALGRFSHEAAAVAADGRVYLTEDRYDGGLYRFTPTTPGDLSAGLLEVATGPAAIGFMTWVEVPDPSGAFTPTRYQVPSTVEYRGGEGIDTSGADVWFTTKYDKRVWHYRTDTETMEIHYQGGSGVLDGLDNLLVDEPSGALFIAEDDGNQELVVIRPDLTVEAAVRVVGQEWSEVTGPCFNPDGTRLYFSSQRAPVGPNGDQAGITYEVTGPWDAYLGR